MIILIILLLFICSALFFSSRWAFDYFGLSCFEQIIFHLKVPLEGTNTEFIFDWFKMCGVKSILFTILFFILALFTSNLIGLLICILLIIGAGHKVGFFEWIVHQFVSTDFYEKYYVDTNKVELQFPEKKQNLIYIFMESMENTYSSRVNEGNYSEDLIPELSKLATENIHFSNGIGLGGARMVAGTGWTTGGMVAQTSGVGLTVPTISPSFRKGKPFLNQVKSLGDILEEQGYNQELCIGSVAAFGGREFYFENHGHFKIFDYESAKTKLPDNYHVFWGYEDKKLFEFAKEEILNLSKQDKPFNFTMLTVDTHHPKGYWDKEVEEIYPERLSNIIRLSSKRIGEFVEWIKEQDFYEDTTIVLCGDHTSMAAEYIQSTYDKDYIRTPFNTIIHSKKEATNTTNRTFTSMDFFPTVLNALGIEIPGDRLGLGTSLFSNKKTLAEEIGLETLDNELKKKSNYYKKNIL